MKFELQKQKAKIEKMTDSSLLNKNLYQDFNSWGRNKSLNKCRNFF